MTYQKFHLARSQGLIGLAISAMLSLIIDFALFKSLGNKQLIPAILLVLMAMVALFSMIAFGRLAFFPPVLYETSPEGLTSYYNAQKGQLRPIGVLIPWAKMRKVEAYESKSAFSTGGGVKASVLQVELEPNHGLPIEVLSVLRPIAGNKEPIDWENTLFLRSETEFGSVQELAAELENKRVASRQAV